GFERLAGVDQRAAHEVGVLGEPGRELAVRHLLRFGAALGRDHLPKATQPLRQRGDLRLAERWLHDAPLHDLALLLRWKLPRFLPADSTDLEIERGVHGGGFSPRGRPRQSFFAPCTIQPSSWRTRTKLPPNQRRPRPFNVFGAVNDPPWAGL